MPTSSDLALFDTNILIQAMNEDAEHHKACRTLRDRALSRVINVCLSPQILFEYFAVVTNPNEMTVPLSNTEALADVEKLAASFPLIFPPDDLHDRVFKLMRKLGFSGRHVFDVVLVATMVANGVTNIYTYDPRFAKIPEITSLTP